MGHCAVCLKCLISELLRRTYFQKYIVLNIKIIGAVFVKNWGTVLYNLFVKLHA